MISGTNCDCKILKTEITETTALITMLVFGTKSTIPSQPFNIYIKDEGSNEKVKADNNTYWIDRINNYDYSNNNVDINKYKEILLKIDITKKNEADIIGNKWIRNIYIYFVNATDETNKIAWSSGKISLISEEFRIPDIPNVRFKAVNEIYDDNANAYKANVDVEFDLEYTAEVISLITIKI